MDRNRDDLHGDERGPPTAGLRLLSEVGAGAFRALFLHGSVAMALTSGEGRLTLANDALCRLLGRPAEELAGLSLPDLVHSEDRLELSRHMEAHRRADAPPCPHPGTEVRFLRVDGSEAWGELSCHRLRSAPEGELFLLVVQDVTHRRRLDEDVLRAERLRSVGRLAGGLAHDFNNILATILGNLSLAASHCRCGGQLSTDLAAAEKACQRARNLTQQLLTFARGGSPVRQPTSLLKVAREAVHYALQGAGLQVEMSTEGGLPAANVDPGQIGQVFQYLLLNARDASERGRAVRLRVALAESSEVERRNLEGGSYLRVEVEDEGHGIAPENLHRVFDPYFTTRNGGTGLGLAAVHSIIRRHGGAIEVESTVDAGTTFRFFLPACQRAVDDTTDEVGRPIPRTGERRRVLVMDDTEPVREVIEGILDEAGFEVASAPDGLAAVQLFKQAFSGDRPFDAVVLDLVVEGGMGGVEALKCMACIDPDVRALVCSGYTSAPGMADPRKYGFRGVVPKPFTAPQLVEELLRILEG